MAGAMLRVRILSLKTRGCVRSGQEAQRKLSGNLIVTICGPAWTFRDREFPGLLFLLVVRMVMAGQPGDIPR